MFVFILHLLSIIIEFWFFFNCFYFVFSQVACQEWLQQCCYVIHCTVTWLYCIDIRIGKFTTGMLFSSQMRCKGIHDDVCTYTQCGNLRYLNCCRAPWWGPWTLFWCGGPWSSLWCIIHVWFCGVSAVPGWQRLILVRTFGIFCITHHYGTLRLPNSYLMQ